MPSSNCILATTKGIDCPKQASPIDFAAFHIDAFRKFSLATFGENLTNIFLLASASLIFTVAAFFYRNIFITPNLAFYKYRCKSSLLHHQKQHLTRWLALHENSPAK